MLRKTLYIGIFAVLLMGASFAGAYLGARSWEPSYASLNDRPSETAATQKSDNKEPAVSRWWRWTTEDPAGFYAFILDVLTGLIFAAGTSLAVYTYRLWASGEKQRVASETAKKRELRAYVGVVYSEIRIDTSDLAAVESKLLALVDYKNAGQTPAHDVHLKMSAKIYDFYITPEWELPTTPEDEGKGGVLVPAVTWRRHREIDGVESNFKILIGDLTNRRKRIWVWGTFSYVDIFGEKSCARFRFRSSHIQRTTKNGRNYFALISDMANSKATYGIKP